METLRLILKPRTIEFLEKLRDSSTEVQMQTFGIDTSEQLQIELARNKRLLKLNPETWRQWDILDKNSKKVIGNCGFHNLDVTHFRAEIGYWLNAKYRRKGIMKETVTRILKFAFEEMNLNRIQACISPDNISSRSVVEHLHFTKEGLLREHYNDGKKIHDSLIYSILKKEFYEKK